MFSDKPEVVPGGKDGPELAASSLIPKLLGKGVTAELYDRDGRRGAVDYLLHYPDGRIAALEVTSAAGEGTHQLYALLAEHRTLPNPGLWTWSATIDDPRDLPELLERCERLIVYCEANAIVSPHRAYEHSGNPDIAWIVRSTVNLQGDLNLPKWDAEEDRERPLFLTAGARSGSVDEALNGFAKAIDEVVKRASVQKRVKKLADSGYEEQHLFIVVDHTALPFDVFYGLTRGTVTPPTAPTLPGATTHLWLVVTFTPTVFLVTAEGLNLIGRK